MYLLEYFKEFLGFNDKLKIYTFNIFIKIFFNKNKKIKNIIKNKK
jgi:hypothetical protein